MGIRLLFFFQGKNRAGWGKTSNRGKSHICVLFSVEHKPFPSFWNKMKIWYRVVFVLLWQTPAVGPNLAGLPNIQYYLTWPKVINKQTKTAPPPLPSSFIFGLVFSLRSCYFSEQRCKKIIEIKSFYVIDIFCFISKLFKNSWN